MQRPSSNGVPCATRLSALVACGLVWSCNALSFLKPPEPSGAPEVAPEVEKMFKAINEEGGVATEMFDDKSIHYALEMLSCAYEGKANNFSDDRTFARPGASSTYGEVLPQSIFTVLAQASKQNPRLHDATGRLKTGRFYDLGSGFGKIVVLAAALGFDSIGYELIGPRFDASCKALEAIRHKCSTGETMNYTAVPEPAVQAEASGEVTTGPNGEVLHKKKEQKQNKYKYWNIGEKLAKLSRKQKSLGLSSCELNGGKGWGRIQLFKGSFTKDDVNISDADVIFGDSVFWNEKMMKTLGEKGSSMKSGSIIVSFKSFPGEKFTRQEPFPVWPSWEMGEDLPWGKPQQSMFGIQEVKP